MVFVPRTKIVQQRVSPWLIRVADWTVSSLLNAFSSKNNFYSFDFADPVTREPHIPASSCCVTNRCVIGRCSTPLGKSVSRGTRFLVTMCTTDQYIYICSHPAAYRFRTAICRNPTSHQCRIRNENSVLPYTCPKCAAKTGARNGNQVVEKIRQRTDIDIMVVKKTWYIPSRCFIDTGFQNLDPFGTGLEAERANQAHRQPSVLFTSRPLSSSNGARANVEVMGEPRQPSPCCPKSKRIDAYPAMRLEGLGGREMGRIVDSFCEGWL